jgi:hypothetical protein
MCNKLLLSVVKREKTFLAILGNSLSRTGFVSVCVCRIEANANLLGNESSVFCSMNIMFR